MLGRLASLVLIPISFAAFSASSNYQLKSYGVNNGGTNNSSSSTYTLQGGAGEISGNTSGAATYSVKSGSIQAQQTNVPGAPTLSNGGGTYYNKLNFIINTSSNPSDTTYVIAVSTTSNFTVTNYVQADGTLNTTQVFQTYSAWGGASGFDAVGLSSTTTYYFKVAAMQGKFTESGFGPSANATTANNTPALSFSVSPNNLDMGNLNAGSVIDSPSNISFTFTTNATYGGTIYVAGAATGLTSTVTSYNITVTPPSGDLSTLTEGFGLKGLSASAPLSIQSPYNGSSNVVGAIYTTFQPVFSSTAAVSSGTASAVLKAKAAATTPAAKDYTDTLTFVAAASY